MNKRQLEVIKSQMRDEERALKEIKQVYRKALKDVESNIQILRGRTDFENMQSIVYQTQYQEAIKAQIEARLDILNSQQFDKMSDYLTHCYESGFVGSMYDLHGQGIPIIAPIDEANVIRALQTDSKISGKLYTKLGADTQELKDSIRANLSRGFSSGADWNVIAKNLDSRMQIGFNRAARIIRTEGHRVRCEASFHAQQVAKSKGADIKKQWDATLDGRTRPNHRLLDGKIVEVDEAFEIDGNEAMYPGEFGIAREDVNCRCQALQRAKWALDEDELQTLKDRAEFYGLDKTQDFEDFTSKYLPAAKSEATKTAFQGIKTLTDLANHLKNDYNASVDSAAIGKLDIDLVKEAMRGFDDIAADFPEVGVNLASITTDKAGVMACTGEKITFNPAFFTDKDKLAKTCEAQSKSRGWHKNASPYSLGVHESAHGVEWALITSNPSYTYQFERITAWNDCTEAKSIVSESCKAVKKTPQGQGKRNAEMIVDISKYASFSPSETMAEAFADVYANGSNAQPLSLEIVKQTKAKMQVYRSKGG